MCCDHNYKRQQNTFMSLIQYWPLLLLEKKTRFLESEQMSIKGLVYNWFIEYQTTQPTQNITSLWLKAGVNFPSCISDTDLLFKKIHKAIFNKNVF